MKNSKIKLFFPHFFINIFIFASISQKCLKEWVNFFPQILWKLLYNLILIWRIQKLHSFFHIFFIFMFIFASISQKMFLKMGQFFFLWFPWKFPYNLILIWRIQRPKSFLQSFLSSSSFLASNFFPSLSGKVK